MNPRKIRTTARTEARAELATFYGWATEAPKLVGEMLSWMRADLNSDGPGPSGGRRSRVEKAERAVTAVSALQARVAALEAECFSFAARLCLTPAQSEGGSFYCERVRALEAAIAKVRHLGINYLGSIVRDPEWAHDKEDCIALGGRCAFDALVKDKP